MTPYQRLVIALARGILVKPKNNMKYVANVHQLGAHPVYAADFSYFPIEAEHELDAARITANAIAKTFWPNGEAGFVQQQRGGSFMASIGVCENGVRRGVTLEILIREYHGVQ